MDSEKSTNGNCSAKQIVGKNTSFINSDFLVDLDSEETRRAIPDRYNRYDDSGADEDMDDEDS